MTKTAVLSWDLPTTRGSGRAISPADIAGVDIEFSANGGADFVDMTRVTPGASQDWTVPDLVDGDYAFRLTVELVDGARSNGVTETFFIDTSAPGEVTNVQVNLS